MHHAWSSLAAPLSTLALTACLGFGKHHHAPEPLEPDTQDVNGATIINSTVLQRESRPLLDVLIARVPNMEVVPDDPCPDVYLRGRSTIQTPSDPAIYVDGQRVTNTCILQMLNAIDLDHVEIYPSGIPRSGYLSSPYGVILIFGRGDKPSHTQRDSLRRIT